MCGIAGVWRGWNAEKDEKIVVLSTDLLRGVRWGELDID